jgi:hypothetical protein
VPGAQRSATSQVAIKSIWTGKVLLLTNNLPTARTSLASRCAAEVWCRRCRHSAPVDLQKLIDQGRGDLPLVKLNWRCLACDGNSAGLTALPLATRGIIPYAPHRRLTAAD